MKQFFHRKAPPIWRAARLVLFAIGLLFMPLSSWAIIVHETASLLGFLSGDAPAVAYDNWISHVSEGAAGSFHYDYGWEPQNTGFGSFNYIEPDEAGDRTLEHWRRIFDSYLLNHPSNVDHMLQDSTESFRYEIVQFQDTDRNKRLYILREQLDSSFVDPNYAGDEDDVIGSFQNGWGVFVLDPNAERPWLMIEVVHPADDYIGVQAAIRLYGMLGAGVLAIHGTGRELVIGNDYQSLSDPSRNGRLPLQVLQEAFADYYLDQPRSAMIIQMHSYDFPKWGNQPVVFSEGRDYNESLLPFRDLSGYRSSIFHLSANPPILENQFGFEHSEVSISEYYEVRGGYNFSTPGGSTYHISNPVAEYGYAQNSQILHIHDHPTYDPQNALIPFLHIELAEHHPVLPYFSWDFDEEGFPTYEDYDTFLENYQPFFDAIINWFNWLDNSEIEHNASAPHLSLESTTGGNVRISLTESSYDYLRQWVEILVDDGEMNPNSPIGMNGADDCRLRKVRVNQEVVLTDLPDGQIWRFGARGISLDGDRGSISNVVSVTLTDLIGINMLHDPFESFPHSAWPPWIATQVDDEADLADITVFFRNGNAPVDSFQLDALNNLAHMYAAPLPVDASDIAPGQLFRYRLRSRDVSQSGNPSYLPGPDSFYEVEVTDHPTVLRQWDFEDDDFGMDYAGDWEHGIPSTDPPGELGAHSGERLICTNLDGPYNTSGHASLLLNDFMKPEYGPLVLTWWQMVDMPVSEEPGIANQGGMLMWSDYERGTDPNGRGFGQVMCPGYNYRFPEDAGGFSYMRVFSGRSEAWERQVVDLFPYYGLGDDLYFYNPPVLDDPEYMGWYIDDLEFSRSVNHFTPTPVDLIAPYSGAILELPEQRFTWHPSTDSDPRMEPTYRIIIEGSGQHQEFDCQSDTSFTFNILEDFDWNNESPELLNWWVLAVSQWDTVGSSDGMRELILPIASVNYDSELPATFALAPAYPNPFNSSVKIRYQVPESVPVKLSIFNILGQRVALLVDREVGAGYYQSSWNAHNQSSGLYLIRLEAGDFHSVQKALLVK